MKELKKVDKKSQTYKNLQKAFEGESAARVRYQIFSSQAKKEGYVHAANVFTESSDNEKEHAEIWFKLLYDGAVPATTECLKIAAGNEKYEWSTMYEEFAKTAKKEGYDNVAELFLGVASVEKFHESRYEQLKKEIDEKTVFSAPKEVYWWCMNCGTFVKGKTPPELCPVCKHPKGYFVQKTVKICD